MGLTDTIKGMVGGNPHSGDKTGAQAGTGTRSTVNERGGYESNPVEAGSGGKVDEGNRLTKDYGAGAPGEYEREKGLNAATGAAASVGGVSISYGTGGDRFEAGSRTEGGMVDEGNKPMSEHGTVASDGYGQGAGPTGANKLGATTGIGEGVTVGSGHRTGHSGLQGNHGSDKTEAQRLAKEYGAGQTESQAHAGHPRNVGGFDAANMDSSGFDTYGSSNKAGTATGVPSDPHQHHHGGQPGGGALHGRGAGFDGVGEGYADDSMNAPVGDRGARGEKFGIGKPQGYSQ